MHIYAHINEPTVRRTFRKHVTGTRGLTVYDKKLRGFGLKVAPNGTKTFFVRTVRRTGSKNIILGTTGKITAAEARRQAVATLEAAKTDRVNGPLFRDHAEHFMRRQARRWKPSTQENNRHLLNRYILPFFGDLHVADIAPADVHRWFDSMSATPANANRALPVLSVMMTQAELWNLRPQGSNPCRKIRRYPARPRERFLSLEELKRLGFVLDHADDTQAAAAVRLLLFTGARSSEITGLKWDWIRGARAVLPDSKTGPKTIQLPPPARAVLQSLPRCGKFVFPNRRGDRSMNDLGQRWGMLRRLADLDDVRLHDCRHTYASHAVMSGLDLYTVGRLLGHADTASTERYAHLADEHVRKAAGRISRIVNDAMTEERQEGRHEV